MHARIWEEEVLIPTYKTGEPNKNPMFFENRVYQAVVGEYTPPTPPSLSRSAIPSPTNRILPYSWRTII